MKPKPNAHTDVEAGLVLFEIKDPPWSACFRRGVAGSCQIDVDEGDLVCRVSHTPVLRFLARYAGTSVITVLLARCRNHLFDIHRQFNVMSRTGLSLYIGRKSKKYPLLRQKIGN